MTLDSSLAEGRNMSYSLTIVREYDMYSWGALDLFGRFLRNFRRVGDVLPMREGR